MGQKENAEKLIGIEYNRLKVIKYDEKKYYKSYQYWFLGNISVIYFK